MDQSGILILGSNGQLGRALQDQYPEAQTADRDELDITNQDSVNNFDWSKVRTILNAAAYTNVDGAESAEGRIAAWQANAQAVGYLSNVAQTNNLSLVHISSDYVFDGTLNPHQETESFSPLSTYGASKAAGDIAASLASNHYILRATWVIGEGKNFVRTMLELGKKGIHPTVVADQIGRLTFTTEIVRAIDHLLTTKAAPGTYNVTNTGDSVSWADITRTIFEVAGFANTVTDTTTSEYFKDKPEAAVRPLQSTLSLDKLAATGFVSHDWREDLSEYIKKELS